MADYITVKEAAAQKGVSVPTIYAAITRGEIVAERILGRYLGIRPEDLEAYIPAPYKEREGVKRPRGPGRQRKQETGPATADTSKGVEAEE